MLGNLFSIVCKLSEDSSLPRDLSEDICQKSFDHKCCKPHYCIWVSKHMSWGGRDSLYFFCVWVIIHLRDWAMYAKKVFCYWSLDCVVFFFQVYLFLCVFVYAYVYICVCLGVYSCVFLCVSVCACLFVCASILPPPALSPAVSATTDSMIYHNLLPSDSSFLDIPVLTEVHWLSKNFPYLQCHIGTIKAVRFGNEQLPDFQHPQYADSHCCPSRALLCKRF